MISLPSNTMQWLQQHQQRQQQLLKYTYLKVDLKIKEVSDLMSESDPLRSIMLLYANTLAAITRLLEPHLQAVKEEAVRYHQLDIHQGMPEENTIRSANSLDDLLKQMSVTEMWNDTCFLTKTVGAIPPSALEREVVEDILSHYNLHLAIHERATQLKDAYAKRSESKEEGKALEVDTGLMWVKIRRRQSMFGFTWENCYHLQAYILSKAFCIPKQKIVWFHGKHMAKQQLNHPHNCLVELKQTSLSTGYPFGILLSGYHYSLPENIL